MTSYGRPMRDTHFLFSPTYTPLNHGSYGASPRSVQETQDAYKLEEHSRPDVFITSTIPKLIHESRVAIAPLLGAPVDEVVFVPNVTTAVNTVLRNLKFEKDDVILYFSTIYPPCEKAIASIVEMGSGVTGVEIRLVYPIEDDDILKRFMEMVVKLKGEGRNVKIAIFETVLSFPGVRMPWEDLVRACKELGVLSMIDGAHGVGHIDLSHVGAIQPDFFVSNCHKWLYTPRSCAVFYVPTRNQHLLRTSLPTSNGYQYPGKSENIDGKTPFVHLFEIVAMIDYTPYLCVPAALKFRSEVCGGEEKIRDYCWKLAREGGNRVAEILGTEVMDNQTNTLTKCAFATVRLPLAFKSGEGDGQRGFDVKDARTIQKWLNGTALEEFDTFLLIAFHGGYLWVRLSGQIYLEAKDFEWIGAKLKSLCERLMEKEMA